MNAAVVLIQEPAATPSTLRGRRWGDRAFKWLALLMALSVIALAVLFGVELFRSSLLARQKFGWHFLASSDWDPAAEQFGALPFIFGTLLSSVLALLIAPMLVA